MLQLGEAINFRLGEFFYQGDQARRNFDGFSSEDVTKSVPDLIADRAAMCMVAYNCSVAVWHSSSQLFELNSILLLSRKSESSLPMGGLVKNQ